MKAHAALQSIIAFQVRYRIPFVWAGNRAGAEYMTFSFLAKYLREIGERYKPDEVATETATLNYSAEYQVLSSLIGWQSHFNENF
jgi:hypothetical protein